MKKSALVLALLSFAGVASASAETIVFNNTGPESYSGNGAYTVGFDPTILPNGASVSLDSAFTLTSSATINEIVAGVWVPHGSTLANVSGGIYTQPFAQGTGSPFGTVSPSSSILKSSGANWDIYEEFFTISQATLGPGTYYLAFLGAVTENNNTPGFTAAWDIADSSQGHQTTDRWNSQGAQNTGLNATTFELLGPSNGAVPEPSSLLLLGSGAAALFGALRRKLKA